MASDEPTPGGADPGSPSTRRSAIRATVAAVITVLAGALVWAILVAPDDLPQLRAGAFARIPLEGLVLAGLFTALAVRPGRVVAVIFGLLIGLIGVLKILDMGFYSALNRPFEPMYDWSYIGPAVGVLSDSIGRRAATTAAVGAAVAAVVLVAASVFATMRLAKVVANHRRSSLRVVGILALAWALCLALGVQVVPGLPVASAGAADFAVDQVRQVQAAVEDRQVFADESAIDSYADTPASRLLTGLRGKDVVIAFIESYGQVAVQGTSFSPGVDSVLQNGTRQLRRAGFAAQSAFLTSPTFGGISWLAHSTLQSGLWVNSQQRYDELVASDRFTLSDAFARAGWRTVVDVPSNGSDFPEATSFYHYDQVYGADNVGYEGPSFSYASMPDQYTWAAFHHNELSGPHPPVMAEIDFVSSHTPWTPLPHLVPWTEVGNGSVFWPQPSEGPSPDTVWQHASDVQAMYGRSIQYSLRSLISYVTHYGDRNLVLVVLGDHEPATIVSGNDASDNVPITLIAHDPAVMHRIASWGWQPGMLPGPDAPVWLMSSFRDQFLQAFGPRPGSRS